MTTDDIAGPIRTYAEVAVQIEKVEGKRIGEKSLRSSESRALKKLRDGLSRDKYILEYLAERGICVKGRP